MCISRSGTTDRPTIRSICFPCSRRSTRRPRDRMSDEAEEIVPDQPLDTLLDEVDHDVREETRETSRENLRVYLKEIERIPLLSREVEEAKARFTEANLRHVVQIARRYLHRGLPRPDLVEVGNLGLLCSVEKFNPER